MKILSAEWCHSCSELKHQLTQMGITYEVIDVMSEEGSKYVLENNIRGLPALLGDEVIVGKDNILKTLT